jgi:uncharacterized protein YegL
MSRRLPTYFLIATSGRMFGEPIEAVKTGLHALVESLRMDPYALETTWVSLLQFSKDAEVVIPLTSIEEIELPDLECPRSGPTCLGAGLKLLCDQAESEVNKSGDARDWRPLAFIMTDGRASDIQVFKSQALRTKDAGFASVIGLAAGRKANKEELCQFCDHVAILETMDGDSLASYFKWVSATVSVGSKSFGATPEIDLPPPPAEINLSF